MGTPPPSKDDWSRADYSSFHDLDESASDSEDATTQLSQIKAILGSCGAKSLDGSKLSYRVLHGDDTSEQTIYLPENHKALRTVPTMVRRFHLEHSKRPRGTNPLYDPDNPTGEGADPREGGRFPEEHLKKCALSVAAGMTSIPETQIEEVPDEDLPTGFDRHDDPQEEWSDYEDETGDPSRLALDEDGFDEDDTEDIEDTPPPNNSTMPKPMDRTLPVSDAYSEYIRSLYRQTSFRASKQFILPSIASGLAILEDVEMTKKYQSHKLDLDACSLIIAVWLLICLRLYIGDIPPGQVRASKCCFSLCLTALSTSSPLVINVEMVENWENQLYVNKNSPWKKELWQRVPVMPSLTKQPRNIIEKEFLDCHRIRDAHQIAKSILDMEEGSGRSPLQVLMPGSREQFAKSLSRLVGSVPVETMTACITGQLPREIHRKGSKVRAEAKKLYVKGSRSPMIYYNSVTDPSGMSPSAAQYLLIVGDLRRYAKAYPSADDLEWIWSIDHVHNPPKSWTRAYNKRGLRRYLDWKGKSLSKGKSYDKNRAKIVNLFANALEKRCQATEQDGNPHQPLLEAIAEIGYTIAPMVRLRDHRNHRSSNYLMNLTEALLRNRFGGFGLTQAVLFAVCDDFHAWLGEIAFTQLVQAYTYNARGFSHFPAGFSNGSAWRKISSEQWSDLRQGFGKSQDERFLKYFDEFDAKTRLSVGEDTLKDICTLINEIKIGVSS